MVKLYKASKEPNVEDWECTVMGIQFLKKDDCGMYHSSITFQETCVVDLDVLKQQDDLVIISLGPDKYGIWTNKGKKLFTLLGEENTEDGRRTSSPDLPGSNSGTDSLKSVPDEVEPVDPLIGIFSLPQGTPMSRIEAGANSEGNLSNRKNDTKQEWILKEVPRSLLQPHLSLEGDEVPECLRGCRILKPETNLDEKWIKYFLGVAQAISKAANCMKTHYGAVIVKDFRIVSTGYTCTPKDWELCENRPVCERRKHNFHWGQRYDLCRSVHAEQNAILNAREDLLGSVLYLYGETADTHEPKKVKPPCLMCRRMIANAGVEAIVVGSNVEYQIYTINEFNQMDRESKN